MLLSLLITQCETLQLTVESPILILNPKAAFSVGRTNACSYFCFGGSVNWIRYILLSIQVNSFLKLSAFLFFAAIVYQVVLDMFVRVLVIISLLLCFILF